MESGWGMSPSARPRTANATAELHWNLGGFYLLVVGAKISPPGFLSPACSCPAALPTLLINWPANNRQNMRSIRQNNGGKSYILLSKYVVGLSVQAWQHLLAGGVQSGDYFLQSGKGTRHARQSELAPTCQMLLITSGQSACQQVGSSKLPEWEGKHDSVISFCS